jgi:hypothetical protein
MRQEHAAMATRAHLVIEPTFAELVQCSLALLVRKTLCHLLPAVAHHAHQAACITHVHLQSAARSLQPHSRVGTHKQSCSHANVLITQAKMLSCPTMRCGSAQRLLQHAHCYNAKLLFGWLPLSPTTDRSPTHPPLLHPIHPSNADPPNHPLRPAVAPLSQPGSTSQCRGYHSACG